MYGSRVLYYIMPLLLCACRYRPTCHPLLHKLITELGVKTKPFRQVDSEKKNKFGFYMRNERLHCLEDVINMYSITQHDLPNFLAVNQFYFSNHPTEFSQLTKAEDGNSAMSVLMPTGQLAKDVTVAQYLLQTGNSELLNLSWSFYPPNDWQLAVAESKIGLITKDWGSVCMVEGGFESVIGAIVSALQEKKNVEMKLNHRVETISENNCGFAIAAGANGEHSGRKVIYACSEVGLRQIQLKSNFARQPKIQRLLSKVDCLPAFKIYLTYERAWWEDAGIFQGIVMSDLPIHCVMAFGEKGKTDSYATLLASYSHRLLELFHGLDLAPNERFANKSGDVRSEMVPSKLLVKYVHNSIKGIMGKQRLRVAFSKT